MQAAKATVMLLNTSIHLCSPTHARWINVMSSPVKSSSCTHFYLAYFCIWKVFIHPWYFQDLMIEWADGRTRTYIKSLMSLHHLLSPSVHKMWCLYSSVDRECLMVVMKTTIVLPTAEEKCNKIVVILLCLFLTILLFSCWLWSSSAYTKWKRHRREDSLSKFYDI